LWVWSRISLSVEDAKVLKIMFFTTLFVHSILGTWCKDFRHKMSLHPVTPSSWFDSHQNMGTLIFAKRGDKDAHRRWFIIKDEGLVLHPNIDLGKIGIVVMALKDVLQSSRNRVD
jgi:hypothetical protein